MLNAIKILRKRARMTQTELANILSIEPSTIAKRESGASMPRAETLLRLAALLHCTVDELLGADNERAEADKSA